MIIEEPFGSVGGRSARSFVVDGGEGVRIRLTDYGARLVELWAPDRDGAQADIVLGFDASEAYAAAPGYLGATVGRYGNRIAGGRLRIGDDEYQLDLNEGPNHLHGGSAGWDRRVWDTEYDGARVTFRTSSPSGEMGYPGACDVRTTYDLDGTDLRITMEVVVSDTTVVNMVHHSYVNLAGHASGDVLDQHLRIPADFYTPVDDDLLPSGEILAVDGSPFDFREPRPIGSHPSRAGDYDHNWCLRASGTGLHEAMDAYDPASGRRLRLYTTEPGIQLYTGAHLRTPAIGKRGARYDAHAGFTLETQKFPGSPQFAHFPSATVEAGQAYRHEMLLRLSTA